MIFIAGARIAKIGNKYYDQKTPNASFRQVALDLKKMGIKNYYFMLEVCDLSVLSIDPHAANDKGHTTLTKDQISRVCAECARNPWYFLREVARVQDPGGGPKGIPYKASRGNIAFTWCINNGYDAWLSLPRQQGKSIAALILIEWMYIFGSSNTNFIFFSYDQGMTKENLSRIKEFIDLLPEYMRCEFIEDIATGKIQQATKNVTTISNPVNKNKIDTKPGPQSYDKAISLARGLTSAVQFFDEPGFTKYIDEVVINAYPAFSTASQRAKENGSAYGRLFTCTPGDPKTQAGQAELQLLEKTILWSEKMYDWNKKEIQNYIDAQGDDRNNIIYIEYHWYQLGLTKHWLKEQLKGMNNDIMKFRREVLLQRVTTSSDSPYEPEDIEYIMTCKGKVIDQLFLNNYYMFKIYRKLQKNIPYLVGVDCSTGTNKDNNAITIINPNDLKVDAEFESSYIGETLFENLLMELCKVIPRCVLVIERNSVGDGIIDHLLHSPIATRLYFDKAKDLMGETLRGYESHESMLKREATKKTYYGVQTTTKSRNDMFRILARHVNEFKENFIGENVIRDISGLIETRSGKIEAGPGFHDDSVMSYLIALYVYYHGNNLKFFGVTKAALESELDNSGIDIEDVVGYNNLPDNVKSIVENTARKEKNDMEHSYQNIMRQAIESSRQDMMKLYSSNLIELDKSVASEFDDNASYSDEMGSIPMDFFDEMNNF